MTQLGASLLIIIPMTVESSFTNVFVWFEKLKEPLPLGQAPGLTSKY
jgi:hypothetical protein